METFACWRTFVDVIVKISDNVIVICSLCLGSLIIPALFVAAFAAAKWARAAHRVGNVAPRAPFRPRFPHHTPVSNHPVHLSLPKIDHQLVVSSAALIHERTR